MNGGRGILLCTLVLVTGPMFWGFLAVSKNPYGELQVVSREHDPVHERLREGAEPGITAYRRYCVGCHGVDGDGKGPAARFLSPRPRDFRQGVYKFRSSEGQSPPTVDDLMRTITDGLHATSMPSWRLLSRFERLALVEYIQKFFPEHGEYGPPVTIPFHKNPFSMDSIEDLEDGIKKGEVLYHDLARCWSCHPGYLEKSEVEALIGVDPGVEYLPSVSKPDVWGEVIKPPDFRVDPMKSIRDLNDIYRVITAGVGGTAMPSWSSLTAEQLWALTFYVDSLRPGSEVKAQISKLREEEN